MARYQDAGEHEREGTFERLLKSRVALVLASVGATVSILTFFGGPILGTRSDIAQLQYRADEVERNHSNIIETQRILAETENNHWAHVQNWELWQVQTMTAIAAKLDVELLPIPNVPSK